MGASSAAAASYAHIVYEEVEMASPAPKHLAGHHTWKAAVFMAPWGGTMACATGDAAVTGLSVWYHQMRTAQRPRRVAAHRLT
jgi:hypothetical protein